MPTAILLFKHYQLGSNFELSILPDVNHSALAKKLAKLITTYCTTYFVTQNVYAKNPVLFIIYEHLKYT